MMSQAEYNKFRDVARQALQRLRQDLSIEWESLCGNPLSNLPYCYFWPENWTKWGTYEIPETKDKIPSFYYHVQLTDISMNRSVVVSCKVFPGSVIGDDVKLVREAVDRMLTELEGSHISSKHPLWSGQVKKKYSTDRCHLQKEMLH